MIKYIAGFLEESNGNPSSMRLNNLIIVCACCTMAVRVVFSEYELDSNTLTLILGLLAISMGSKVIQKKAEVNGEIEEKKAEKTE